MMNLYMPYSSYHVLLSPELLGENFNGREKRKIDLATFAERLDKEGLAALTGRKSAGNNNIVTLIALDKDLRYVNTPAYRERVSTLISAAKDAGRSAAIKRHPGCIIRDPDAEKFLGQCCAAELEPNLPVEFYYFSYSGSRRYVVGSLGTTLLTARALLPGAVVESFVTEEQLRGNPYARQILEFYAKLGVTTTLI